MVAPPSPLVWRCDRRGGEPVRLLWLRRPPVRGRLTLVPMSEPGGYDDPELLPEQTSDDTDRGWGEHPDDRDDDERITREKPPHW